MSPPALAINDPDIVAEVEAAFRRYETALVGNDLETLDALFWASPLTVRYGATENLYGIAEIRAFRKARPSAGLQRTLSRAVITTFGRDFATASAEFVRGDHDVVRQQQSWVRVDGEWRVVAAHVSSLRQP